MNRKYQKLILTSAISVALASPVLAGNKLTDPGFEDSLGLFTSPSGPITDNTSTCNTWRARDQFQSVNSASLINSPPLITTFPTGWGGTNFAQHSQFLTLTTSDDGDNTDQLTQCVDGSTIVPNKPVNVSFKYVNNEGGRQVIVRVFGINAGQSWSEFAPWNCTGGCTLLYTNTINIPFPPPFDGWHTHSGQFTPTTPFKVVAIGIQQGGHNNYARGVDDVVLSQNQPPDCSGASPSIAELWSPNHNFVPINILGVTDSENDVVTITVNSIRQDEGVLAAGSGNTKPDGTGVGTSTAEVRAERVGGGNGRVYHIGFTADDGNGGSCTSVVQVSVPNSVKGAAVDNGALFDSTVQ